MRSDLWALAVLLSLWCCAHSLLAARTIKNYITARLGVTDRSYRLVYNLLALVSLLPILQWSWTLPAHPLVVWTGSWRVLRALMWLIALVLFWGGCRGYDLLEFAGLRAPHGTYPQTAPPLVTTGMLGLVRHPWYSGVFILLWARNLDPAALVVSSIFSLYLLIGTVLEERRLISELGEPYRSYRRRVPMFIPWRWLLQRFGIRRDR